MSAKRLHCFQLCTVNGDWKARNLTECCSNDTKPVSAISGYGRITSLRHKNTWLTRSGTNVLGQDRVCMFQNDFPVIPSVSSSKWLSTRSGFMTRSELVKMYVTCLTASCKQRLIFTRSWLGKKSTLEPSDHGWITFVPLFTGLSLSYVAQACRPKDCVPAFAQREIRMHFSRNKTLSFRIENAIPNFE